MKKIFFMLFLFVSAFLCFCGEEICESDILSPDPSVTIKQLENGLTYYIKENRFPEDQAYLRLVVKSGSLMEDEDQQGLAHLMEHMEFNGTENFPGNKVIDFLELHGVRFGPDINAYTSFGETVFMINISSDDAEALDTSVRILSEWAGRAALDPEEIEKERKVVIEEWRRDKGASERIFDFELKNLFKGSRFAERMPIGKIEILKNFKKPELERYYKKWFRPDLMAVIAVGDFDGTEMEEKIIKYFSGFPRRDSLPEIIDISIPDHSGTEAALLKEPESNSINFKFVIKDDPVREESAGDYKKSLTRNLFLSMLSDRYDEIRRSPDPPFINASAGFSNLPSSKSFFSVSASLKGGNIFQGISAVMGEVARAAQHGFTDTELARTKEEFLRSIGQLYNERDKSRSDVFAAEYARNFSDGEYMPGIEKEYELYKKYIPEISVEEVNETGKIFMKKNNRIILLSGCENSFSVFPDEAMLAEISDKALQSEKAPYTDITAKGDIIGKMPLPGSAVSKSTDEKKGITRLLLSNGAEVFLKPTDFKNDQVLFSAVSLGGNSLVSDDEWPSSIIACPAVMNCGLGSYTKTELDKYLKTKRVSVTPYLDNFSEGFSGSSSKDDFEDIFRLLYLYFTEPGKDRGGYDSYISRLDDLLKNRDSMPDVVFGKTVMKLLTQGHPRGRDFDSELLKEVSYENVYKIFRSRFSDPGDFAFVFTGNFDIEEAEKFCCEYIASIPNDPGYDPEKKEKWQDRGMRVPEGAVSEDVYKGNDFKSRVLFIMKGKYPWSFEENETLDCLSYILDMRLREVIREDLGGTYSINVYPDVQKYPVEEYLINIYFGCSPDRTEELKAAVIKEIEDLKKDIPDEYIMKYKTSKLIEYKKNLMENYFWVSALTESLYNRTDLDIIDKYEETVLSFHKEMLLKKAEKYFHPETALVVALYPEKEEGSPSADEEKEESDVSDVDPGQ